MSGSRYLVCGVATVLALAAICIILCVVVDPYRMFGTPTVPGWTRMKSRIYQREDLAKAYQLARVVPRTLLLGNSRVEVGLDPASTSWPAEMRPVFNAAEAGRGPYIALRLLQDSIAIRPPRTVVLGLDFLDFLQKPSPPDTPLPPESSEDFRLMVDREGKPNRSQELQLWKDRLLSTLSLDSLLDSLGTVIDQNPRTATTMTQLGFNPLHEYTVFVSRDGYHALFAQKDAIYTAEYRSMPRPDFGNPELIQSFRLLKAIIDLTRKNDINLVLFIYPYHARFLEILHKDGLWSNFEAWKRALVRTCECGKAPNGTTKLYDFSGYNNVTTEMVPPANDTRTQMRWYWESGHFKAALGDLIVERIFGASSKFGVELDAADLGQVLEKIREDRHRYLATYDNSSRRFVRVGGSK